MGARFTSTLVAANLLAVSGLCGLSLVAAFDALRSGGGREARAAAASSMPVAAGEGRYPTHAVRIVTRSNRPQSFEQGRSLAGAAPIDSPDQDPIPDGRASTVALETPESADAGMAQAAERLALIETAAGPEAVERATPARPAGPQEANGALHGLQLANLPTRAASERSAALEPEQKPAADAARVPATRPSAPRTTPEYSRPLPPAPVQSSAPETGITARTRGHVVIGSFTDPAEAEGHRALYKHLAPKVVPAEVDGRLYHRVVVGPFERAALKPAKQRIVAAGITDAWILIAPLVTANPDGKRAGKDARDGQAHTMQVESPSE